MGWDGRHILVTACSSVGHSDYSIMYAYLSWLDESKQVNFACNHLRYVLVTKSMKLTQFAATEQCIAAKSNKIWETTHSCMPHNAMHNQLIISCFSFSVYIMYVLCL